MLTGDMMLVGVLAVLLVAIIVLVLTLREAIGKIHDSVSSSNLGPLYQTLLPLGVQYGTTTLEAVGGVLEERAARTPTTLDDEIVKQIQTQIDQLSEMLRGLESRVPSEGRIHEIARQGTDDALNKSGIVAPAREVAVEPHPASTDLPRVSGEPPE
jgi:hypothetical protein